MKYTLILHTGHKDVPAGNQLALQASVTVNSTRPCTLSTAGRTIQLGQSFGAVIPRNDELTCEVMVGVNNDTHMQAGQVPPFSVTAVYSGPNISTHEFWVEPHTTSSVPVYTGTSLSKPTSELQGILFHGR